MKNYLRFLSPVMLLLMAVMFGGGKILAQNSETFNFYQFTKSETVVLTGKDCIITLKKNNGGNDPAWNDKNKEARVYAKGSIAVSSKKKITKIVYNYVANAGGSKKEIPTISKVTPDGFTDSSKTWSSETGSNNVVMTLGGSAGNFGFTSLDITYEDDGKTPTTLSFSKSESSFTYDLKYNGGIAELVNPATLSPNVEGATISYTISESKFADGKISIDNGTVTFSTNKEASATITASYAGNDTYAASTASYIIKIVDPNALVFSDDDENNSFKNLPTNTYSSSAKDYNLLAENGLEYTFNMNYCYKNNGGIQMKSKDGDNGVIISPKFGFSYGYTVTIEYTSGDGITLSAGDKTVTGEKNSSISLTTKSDIPFTIKTGSKYAVVKTIRVVANSAPETESLTTSAGGYATYSADYAVNYSELGLTAYTLTVDESKKTVTAKEFTGVVPAGKAVLVKGTASTAYTLTPASTEGDATFATDLKTGATTANGTQYGFTSKFGTPAFAQVASGQDIPAKKGYIVLNGASAAKYSICFGDEATGIQTIEAASAANAAMYNLAGQRVDKAYKGIVIVNGKKYLNK